MVIFKIQEHFNSIKGLIIIEVILNWLVKENFFQRFKRKIELNFDENKGSHSHLYILI